jgi:hypothetical protein
MRFFESGRKARQQGNVLFMILVAIALLAALTFSATRTARVGGDMSAETARLHATEILGFAAEVEDAVARLMFGGCLETEISFENTVVAGYANASAPPGFKCHVFKTPGGGIQFKTFEDAVFDAAANAASTEDGKVHHGNWMFSGKICVANAGSGGFGCEGNGSDDEDLVMALLFLNEAVCEQINIVLGLSGIGADQGDSILGNDAKFTGAYAETSGNAGIGDNASPTLIPPTEGCYEATAGGGSPGAGYVFYKVLLAR